MNKLGISRDLISVYDKTGLENLARALHDDASTAAASLGKLKPSGHYTAAHFAH